MPGQAVATLESVVHPPKHAQLGTIVGFGWLWQCFNALMSKKVTQDATVQPHDRYCGGSIMVWAGITYMYCLSTEIMFIQAFS